MIGQIISHYKILEKLGEGGMGVVYKAEDTKLKRIVALKFLPPHLSASEQDKSRFIQEAQAASSLNHPNVCTIHDIQDHEGPASVPQGGTPAGRQMFIVMEFVDGQTLREKQGTISFKQAVDIGIQVADGLAAAHGKGIVHRDIKPENIMIRKDGIAQIMDFGLAKLRASGSKITRLTKEGSTVGTAGYMSPEQVQGQDADHRSDIFSYGVLLYELLTGQLPFKGVHETALAYEIVNVDAPPMSSVKPEIDLALDAIVLECLEKDPNERTQSIKQVSVDLNRYKRGSGRQGMSKTYAVYAGLEKSEKERPSTEMRTHARRNLLSWGLVILLCMLSAFLLIRLFSNSQVHRQQVRASLIVPESLYIHAFGRYSGPPVISPDGRNIVFVGVTPDGVQQLYIRPVDALEVRKMEGTRQAFYPFWSHDGKQVGFFTMDGKLKKVETAGGPPVTLCSARLGRGGSWASDGTILFTPDYQSTIYKISSDGGVPELLTTLDTTRNEGSHRWPFFLPDGNHFLYFNRISSSSGEAEGHAVFVGSLDRRTNKLIVHTTSNAIYASGKLLYLKGTTLMAQDFDAQSLELKGEAMAVAERVMAEPANNLAVMSASQTGTLIYLSGLARTGAKVLLMDRSGKVITTLGDPASHWLPRFSPDGERVLTSTFDTKTIRLNIWMHDTRTGGRTRITSGPGEELPVWSPDGSHVAYTSRKMGTKLFNIHQKQITQTGDGDVLYTASVGPSDWSQDGKWLLLSGSRYEASTSDIIALAMDGDHKAVPFLQTEYGEWDGRFSPDGKWVAYTSDESGEQEVYLKSFGGSDPRTLKVSSGGGMFPRWGKTRDELFYMSTDNKIMLATLHLGDGAFEVSGVRPLFAVPHFMDCYDVSRDGGRIVMSLMLEAQNSSPITVVANWMEGLEGK